MNKILTIMMIMGFSLSSADTLSKNYPTGEVGKMVKLGEEIIRHTNTHPMTKDLINTKLACQNCHIASSDDLRPGTTKNIGTFIATAAAFPAYSKRHKRIISLKERIDGCFVRCMGADKSFMGTKQMRAVEAYITWLSEGKEMKMNLKGARSHNITKLWEKNTKKFAQIQRKATYKNYLNGEKLYKQKCASCHGQNGEGVDGLIPLWGKDKDGKWLAYGADGSMAKLNNSATWMQDNMPLTEARTLSDQEAADVALFINTHERKSYKDFKVEDNFKAFGLDLKKIRGE